MATCPIVLKNHVSGEDPYGHFYLISAPVGYDNSVSVSSGGPFSIQTVVPFDSDPAEGLIPGGYQATLDLSGEASGTYIIRYVTPAVFNEEVTDPSQCGDCVSCAEIVLNKLEVEDTASAQFCELDTATYNLFVLAGADPLNSTVEYAPGSPTDLDFDLVVGSTYGDFKPIFITPATYTFLIDRVGSQDCENCQTVLTITFLSGESGGESSELLVCSSSACIVNLFDSLSGSPLSGGKWVVSGGDLPASFKYGTCPSASTPITVNIGSQVGSDENVCIDLDEFEGTVTLTYIVPSDGTLEDCGFECVSCSEVTISAEQAPESVSATYCSSDTSEIVLWDLLDVSPFTEGTWVLSSGPSTWTNGKSDDGDGTNDFFVPAELEIGEYVFEYTIESACSNCTAQVIITIANAEFEYSACASENGQVNLFDLIGAPEGCEAGNWLMAGGDWTVGKSADNDGTNDYFIPSDLGVGEYLFTYSPSNESCCAININVTLFNAGAAGDNQAFVACIYNPLI